MRLLRVLSRLLVMVACSAGAAHAADVAGVRFDERIDAQGAPLQLNGAGVRYRTIFKVYAAALYLGERATTPDGVLAAAGPKRLRITMLRDIDSADLGRLFVRGVEDNALKGEMAQLVPGLLRMSQIFSDQKRLAVGDTFLIDWLPGRGTLITVKDKPQGMPFPEPEFFAALLRIWLGPQPADRALKEALLGGAP